MQEQLQHYELMLIISGAAGEDKHPEILSKIRQNLEKNGAEKIQIVTLGRKKFAYAIKNLRHGFYFTCEFELRPSDIKTTEEALRLNTSVLRFLTIKKKIKTLADVERESKLKEGKIKARLKKEVKEADDEKKARRDAGKVSLEDLDKKLDEILEQKMI